uniref:NADH dehydrogenase subunit 4L n=1 Tax=Parasagitta elegans TaxID=1562708 RepID=A0A141CL89_9BILA|nr:NADH dehydrogenase subunit 4L [Parasagitta elegans]AKS04285.1 NADH dehydrogenase subunit 4L [Parasagitta elegans]
MWLKFLLVSSLFVVIAIFSKNSFLSILLCLESLVLIGVLVLIMHSELMFSVIFISVGACESAVGLACLVGMVRYQGSAQLTV